MEIDQPCPPQRAAHLISVYDGDRAGRITHEEMQRLLRGAALSVQCVSRDGVRKELRRQHYVTAKILCVGAALRDASEGHILVSNFSMDSKFVVPYLKIVIDRASLILSAKRT